MRLLALDIATSTGWAYGPADGKPLSGSVRLKRPQEPREVAPGNLGAFLRDRFDDWHAMGMLPDLIFVEDFLNPVAQPSADAAIVQLMCHGAMHSEAAQWGIKVEKAMPATIRRHFVGQARVAKGGPKDAIKRLVRDRCALLGYVDKLCVDFDRTDALAAWDYAAHLFGRRRPADFELFRGAR